MIQEVKTKRQLKVFIDFIKMLYQNDSHMVYPLFSVLKKELTEQVLQTKRYTALLCYRDEKVVDVLKFFGELAGMKKEDIDKPMLTFYDSTMYSINEKEVNQIKLSSAYGFASIRYFLV